MTSWTHLPQHILDENPEVADLLRRKPSVRLKNERARLYVNYAPSFLAAWKLTGTHWFPDPESEYRFYPGRRFAYDWCWSRYKVAVEVDGGQWTAFGGRHATDGDRAKLNLGASLGYLIFKFSPEQLKDDPVGCVSLVIQALELRASSLDE